MNLIKENLGWIVVATIALTAIVIGLIGFYNNTQLQW